MRMTEPHARRRSAFGGRLALLLAAVCAISLPVIAAAQPAGGQRIAFLSPASAASMAARVAAFNEELRDLGIVEGRDITTHYRWGEGKDVNLARFATALVALRPDVIVVHGVAAAQAAQKVAGATPIICYACGDVISTGLVANLARPGVRLR
jgi:putative ABC transport system substrate-binding protein